MRVGKDAKKQRNKILLFLGLSFLLHVLFVVIAPLDFSFLQSEKKEKTLTVDIDPSLLSPQNDNAKQIVESQAAPTKTPPKDAKYLGERSQSVEQETKAHKVDSFRPGKTGAISQNPQNLTLKNLAPQNDITPPKEGEYADKTPPQPQVQQSAPGQEAADNDLLHGVKEGDQTMLNTKEFVYFGYYHRIRERLERSWNSRLRSTMEGYIVSGRHLAADREYMTRIIVVLDRHGHITAVQVLGASGARDLDQAAVDAFNQAGPFPDPPSGLVDKNGEIRIRWDFVLQS